MIKSISNLLVLFLLGFVIYGVFAGQLPNIQHRAIVLAVVIVLTLFYYPARNPRAPWVASMIDVILGLIGVGACVYVSVNYWDIMMDQYAYRPYGLALGGLLSVVILELARRTIGVAFGVIAAIFTLYTLFGQNLPGRLGHGGVSYEPLISLIYFSTDGIWGQIFDIFSSLLVLFILFSSLMTVTGTGDKMIRLASYLGGRSRGGAAKIAVIASAFIGSVTGSAVTNVAMTGTLTIPMMKRLGYKKEVAAAIEATASSGGQITPPMMGAGLFLMAEFLNIEISRMMLIVMVPALLFYLGVLASVHFESSRNNIGALPEDELPARSEVMNFSTWGPILVPFVVLVAAIAAGQPAGIAILASTAVLLVLYLAEARSWRDLTDRTRTLGQLGSVAGRSIAMLGALCAAAGILIGVIGMVGLGIKFGDAVLSLASNNMFAALVLSGFVVMIIGMGMPTTAAYVLASSVILTAFLKLGIPELSAHMFIFYFATLSAITPPVCAAVFVAAGIAESKVMPTAIQTMRFAGIKYVLPFLFVFRPELLLSGDLVNTSFIFGCAALATVAFSGAFSRYLTQELNLVWSAMLVVSGLLLLSGNLLAITLGLGIFVAIAALPKLLPGRSGSKL